MRALSSIIGVSFSTLARIERGEGEPDNNSQIRILEWLGDHAREAGLSFENVALVHFRASKNVGSKTIRCLLLAADHLKRAHDQRKRGLDGPESGDGSGLSSPQAAVLSKDDMEQTAEDLRKELEVPESAPFNALQLEIVGVDVLVPAQLRGLPRECVEFLTGAGSPEWSAMSVPLDDYKVRWAILRNDKHNLERQKVTYLEECWHILLGHRLTRVAKVADSYGRTFESSEEHDAYYLAAATLLPSTAVIREVAARKSAETIAEMYGVSKELVEYRIKRLGLWRAHKGMTVSLATERKS